MSRRISERRVVMARNVARKWLFEAGSPEFRFRVFIGSVRKANLCTHYLRKFRDGESSRVPGVPVIEDLGISPKGDSFFVWSRNRKALVQLKDYYEKQGFETTGIW